MLMMHSDQFRCIIDLAYLTAMRKGDLLRLNLSDIRENGLYVKQGKTGKRYRQVKHGSDN